jgi:hypothetical protein
MSDSVVISLFQKVNIAELNSLRLFDYEDSLNNYFSNNNSSNLCQQYFKWFEHTKFNETNSHMNYFEKWFYDFFL